MRDLVAMRLPLGRRADLELAKREQCAGGVTAADTAVAADAPRRAGAGHVQGQPLSLSKRRAADRTGMQRGHSRHLKISVRAGAFGASPGREYRLRGGRDQQVRPGRTSKACTSCSTPAAAPRSGSRSCSSSISATVGSCRRSPSGLDNWVACEDGRIVGYAAVDAAQELEHAAEDAATGDALLARAEERARERGFDTLAATAVPEDEPLTRSSARRLLPRSRDAADVAAAGRRPAGAAVARAGSAVRAYEAADAERVHALLDEAYAGWDREYVVLPHDEWVAFMTDHDEFDPRSGSSPSETASSSRARCTGSRRRGAAG